MVGVSSGHEVKVGEFILFQYVPSDEHFIVQIFGTSGYVRTTLAKLISLVVELHLVKYNVTEDNHGMFCSQYFIVEMFMLCCLKQSVL